MRSWPLSMMLLEVIGETDFVLMAEESPRRWCVRCFERALETVPSSWGGEGRWWWLRMKFNIWSCSSRRPQTLDLPYWDSRSRRPGGKNHSPADHVAGRAKERLIITLRKFTTFTYVHRQPWATSSVVHILLQGSLDFMSAPLARVERLSAKVTCHGMGFHSIMVRDNKATHIAGNRAAHGCCERTR